MKRNRKNKIWFTVVALSVLLGIFLTGCINVETTSDLNYNIEGTVTKPDGTTETFSISSSEKKGSESISEEIGESGEEKSETLKEDPASTSDLKFRKKKYLDEHYEKHGVEMGFASAEEYLAAANAVVANPDALHKKEAEDGDDIYYLEETNEFVVVSGDGYIRTYFNPSAGIDYYNRQ